MASLHYGNVVLAREGTTVSCLVDGVVIGTVVVDNAGAAPHAVLAFSGDHTFWLNADEMRHLFDVAEEPVAEATPEVAEEPVAENVTAEEETPVVFKKRRRS